MARLLRIWTDSWTRFGTNIFRNGGFPRRYSCRDKDVARAREHRPVSRGSRTAPSPTRVVLRRARAALLASARARQPARVQRPHYSPGAMDCLVTGGAGFIGSNLVDALIARGDRVTVIDNLSTGKQANLEHALAAGADLRVVDMRDGQAISETFAAASPELVFHLAAQIDVRHSVEWPADDANANVLGTIA